MTLDEIRKECNSFGFVEYELSGYSAVFTMGDERGKKPGLYKDTILEAALIKIPKMYKPELLPFIYIHPFKTASTFIVDKICVRSSIFSLKNKDYGKCVIGREMYNKYRDFCVKYAYLPNMSIIDNTKYTLYSICICNLGTWFNELLHDCVLLEHEEQVLRNAELIRNF